MLSSYQINTQDVLRNSFKDFHAKGLDYICLKRSNSLTVKLYIFDGDASKMPEVVNPHDHRYGFETTVLAGRMADHRFRRGGAEMFQEFNYLTPLNGGSGFTYLQEARLSKAISHYLDASDILYSRPNELHTIQMLSDQTVLLVKQFEDVIPVGVPTKCFVRAGEPKPNTSGLYSEFTADDIRARLRLVNRLCGITFEEATS